ncbi:hypothetical protein MMC16_006812 [Acarospora aff. strigata]|nr:hypothetical protein [Acarospora aff. strigata]
MESSTVDSDEERSYQDDHSSLGLSLSEVEEESDYGDKLSALHDLVSSVQPEVAESSDARNLSSGVQESSVPSDFGFNAKQKLTVADLLPTIATSDPRLGKSLKLLDTHDPKADNRRGGIPAKLRVPLPKRQQNRLDRAAAYEKSKQTLDRWIESVKFNRRAEHLCFPLVDPTAAAPQGLDRLTPTSYSKPFNNLESAIQDILQHSGLASGNGLSQEDQILASEGLQSNKISFDEVQSRRDELRKARELLFREEVRAKRIKKIKSKSYRRVHRKQRERVQQADKDALAAAGVLLSDEEHERNERRRAEERMGARHRESKWARGVKDSGRAAWDDDARAGFTEMAKRGEELRKRIEGKDVRPDDVDGSDSGSETSENKDGETPYDSSRDHTDKSAIMDGSTEKFESNLSSMSFMRKAEGALRQRNDRDEQQLHTDLDGEEPQSDSEGDSGIKGRRKYEPSNRKSIPTVNVGNLTRSELEDGEQTDDENERVFGEAAEDVIEVVTDATTKSKAVHSSSRKRKSSERDNIDKQTVPEVDNPWLVVPVKKPRSHKTTTQDSESFILSQEILQGLPAYSNPDDQLNSRPKTPTMDGSGTSRMKDRRRPVSKVLLDRVGDGHDSDTSNGDWSGFPVAMSNQELVKKAFAGDEVVANFDQEKKEIAQDEDERVVDNTLPGWGNWTGVGISKKEIKRNRGRFLTKEEGTKQQNRKDRTLDRVIINEKRVKKVSWFQSAIFKTLLTNQNVKYYASQLPHPFETRQQYERSLRLPVGPEWTTKETFQTVTKPRILMKQGVITPMERPFV